MHINNNNSNNCIPIDKGVDRALFHYNQLQPFPQFREMRLYDDMCVCVYKRENERKREREKARRKKWQWVFSVSSAFLYGCSTAYTFSEFKVFLFSVEEHLTFILYIYVHTYIYKLILARICAWVVWLVCAYNALTNQRIKEDPLLLFRNLKRKG